MAILVCYYIFFGPDRQSSVESSLSVTSLNKFDFYESFLSYWDRLLSSSYIDYWVLCVPVCFSLQSQSQPHHYFSFSDLYSFSFFSPSDPLLFSFSKILFWWDRIFHVLAFFLVPSTASLYAAIFTVEKSSAPSGQSGRCAEVSKQITLYALILYDLTGIKSKFWLKWAIVNICRWYSEYTYPVPVDI